LRFLRIRRDYYEVEINDFGYIDSDAGVLVCYMGARVGDACRGSGAFDTGSLLTNLVYNNISNIAVCQANAYITTCKLTSYVDPPPPHIF